MLDLATIAAVTGGRVAPGEAGGVVPAGVSTDSRAIGAGELFVALRGEAFDGHDFLDAAAGRGAAAAVVSRLPAKVPGGLALILVEDTLGALQALAADHRRRTGARVVAVTGSCGKTTTKEMIAAIAALEGSAVATQGNLNNHIGLPLTLLGARRGDRFIVAEMGCNHEGEIALLTRIADPDVGLVTCVEPTHTQFLGDIDGVARAKSELFAGMRRDAVAVVNLDDPRVRAMAPRPERCLGYSARGEEEPGADVRLLDAVPAKGGAGQVLSIAVGGRVLRVTLRLHGHHNARNAVAAAAAALAAGLQPASIAEGLGAVQAIRGRGAVYRGRFSVVDEAYNASPAAVRAALEMLAAMPAAGRRIAVLGDMLELGEKAEAYHREAGRLAAGNADALVAVGSFVPALVSGAREGGIKGAALGVSRAEDALAAILGAGLADDGDIVLVKGSRAVKMEIIVSGLLGLLG